MNLPRPLLTSVVLFLLPLAASAGPVAEEKLQGAWRDADRKSVIEFTRDPAGLWWGKTIEAVHAKEAGKVVFRKLVYDAKTNSFTGLMIKPDDDDDATMPVTVTLVSETSMTAVVKKFIFSKTLSLTKEAPPPEAKK